ncbi:MAG: hypothetical protein EHM55_08260 [Acidobacteria bacterium]|nr:MAG: hypothetical protein EHM55_08260 [Acidobacteriota bacterium]
MRLVTTLVALALALNVVALSGQGRGNGQAKKPAAQTTRTKVETPKGKTQTKQTTKVETRTARVDARAAKAETKAAKAETKAAKAETKAARKTGTVATTTTTTGTEITPTTPTSQPVKNPKLEARLQGMLPPDMTVQDAMAGFKNWGQFVAAVHVSNNLNIPFADLKAKMTGMMPGPTPGTTVQGTPTSLGQAIQSLKGGTTVPDEGTLTTTKIQTEVKKAEDAATTDLRLTRDRS